MVAEARIPRPPAALVAAVSRAPATHPMPVCMIGYSTPNSSQARVCSAASVTQRTSLSARTAGIDHLADQSQLFVGRHPRLGNVVGHDQLETGGRDDLVDRHAGMHRPQPHAIVGRLEVERARGW